MKFNKGLILILVCILSFAATADFPDYKAALIDWEEYITRDGGTYDSSNLESFVSRGYVYHTAVAAAAKIRMYEWTQQTAYADKAVEYMQVIIDNVDGISDSFFLPHPFTDAYVRMKAAGVLTQQLDDEMSAFADSKFTTTSITAHADEIHNQHFARAAGLAFAAQVWPSASRAAQWSQYSTDFFNRVIENADITENAPNYEYICLFYFWHLADKLGRADEIENENFKKMFMRYTDCLAPSGKMGEYGDSGSITNNPDWPLERNTTGFAVAAMFRAAGVFEEPKFQWAAERIYQVVSDKEPLENHSYQAIVPLYAMTYIEDWRNESITPAMGEFESNITTRRYRTYINSAFSDYQDKLILCQSKQAGEPFLMMDLFTPHGSHTHINQHVSVNYYEYDGVPLLTTNGYHGWGPESSNLCLIRDAQSSFPYPVPAYPALQWQTAEVPLANVRSFGQEGFVTFDKLNLRMNNTSDTLLAGRYDNLRLYGPAGELLIDGFETTDGWSSSQGAISLVTDRTQGDYALQIGFTENGTYFNTKEYGATTVDLSEYTHLKIDWKYSNNSTAVRPLIFRLEATENTSIMNSGFHLNFLQMFSERNKAFATQNADFSYGSVKCSRYFTHDTQFARRMFMTADGVLIVRDDMLPGEAASGRNAGPLWNLASTAQPYSGSQWVSSSGGSKELFVYMDSANAADEIGYQTVDISYARDNQRAAFTRKVLQTDTAERFISVLVPREPSDDLAALASSVSVVQDAAGFVGKTEVSLALEGEDAKTYVIDVLYEDDITSTVVYGELGGNMAIKSYDKQPQARSVGGFVFDVESAQVGYDTSSGSDVVVSMLATGARQVEYGGVVLAQSTIPASLKIEYSSEAATGTIDAPDGAVIILHSPSEQIELFDSQGVSVMGIYDSETNTYNITIGEGVDCDAVIAAGYRMPADISGPEGEPDCVVNMYDFAELAKGWLTSTIE